ncbi:MAG TPA: rhomboid family intramembrane serine protease [Candidatus Polarisedimenticolia bacterium]|nr:rhomboid family intramembrane serine protease [Candidatus Polarisedimenticolia bacterium]
MLSSGRRSDALLPLKDDLPTRIAPWVTVMLIAANVGVFIRLLLLPVPLREQTVLELALVPHDLTHPGAGGAVLVGHGILTLFTSMFVHGGWMHLLGNMLYLWIFGNNVEDLMGHGRFLGFYLIAGLAGAGLQIAVGPETRVPMIGASGAIAGVLGAYLVLFPTARVSTLIVFVFFVRIVEVPALIVLGVWLLIQLLNAGAMGPGGVAWFAHLGGFLAGLILVAIFRRRRVRQSLY